ncbi:hypothetical protein [Gracilibacillus sp. YIM 98692]|uniref:hypothetical protein n=1 Tax=Gracilibacillus sp. YIM 98692 TaxID=2663532 RepID=UPI001969B2D0|nr:hypothetical protein [Gracilibacillus sp. YIM 98692]
MYLSKYQTLEDAARSAKIGIHSIDGYVGEGNGFSENINRSQMTNLSLETMTNYIEDLQGLDVQHVIHKVMELGLDTFQP